MWDWCGWWIKTHCWEREERKKRRNQRVLEIEKLENLDLQQKSKIRWLTDDNENSRFFYSSLKIKNMKCNIHGLMVNGTWITEVEAIKLGTWRFFGDKFRETHTIRPTFSNPNFKKLDPTDNIFMEGDFSIEEIKDAIWNCGSN